VCIYIRLPPFAGGGKITREERERKYGQREMGCISIDQQQFSYSLKNIGGPEKGSLLVYLLLA
jgi:hypothetical protein